MADEAANKSWFSTLPGILSAITALLTALAGVIAALSGAFSNLHDHPAATASQDCLPGYVWRLAISDDHVCVTEESRRQTEVDNQLGGSRRNPAGGPYGADTCQAGYVWREAFPEDLVCVTPNTRAKVRADNAQAATHIRR